MKIIDLSKPIQYNKSDPWFMKVKIKHKPHRKAKWLIRFLGLPFRLFPKNFIIDLPIPSNHSGLEKLFPKEILKNQEIEDQEIDENPFFKVVKDHSLYPDDKDCDLGWMPPIHKKDHDPLYDSLENPIPPSLRKAVISFIF